MQTRGRDNLGEGEEGPEADEDETDEARKGTSRISSASTAGERGTNPPLAQVPRWLGVVSERIIEGMVEEGAERLLW